MRNKIIVDCVYGIFVNRLRNNNYLFIDCTVYTTIGNAEELLQTSFLKSCSLKACAVNHLSKRFVVSTNIPC